MSSRRIIILGGGFAGVKCARTLRKKLPKQQCEIILFNRQNHMVFHPLLAEVAGASVQPKDVAAPLRQLLPGCHCRTEEVLLVDPDGKRIEYEAHDGQRRLMSYDHLVLACGNTVNLGLVPGMTDHAFAMKTIGDALALQAHIMEQLEKADVCDNLEKKRWYLSFNIVGGGFSGVEVAGEINDLVRSCRKFYTNIQEEDISVTLIHSGAQILPEVNPSLRDFAGLKMEERGVKIQLNAMAKVTTAEGVGLQDGTWIRGATTVCTIGTAPLALIEKLKVRKERGRVVTNADMSLPDYPNIWAIGDCAHIISAATKQVCPPTGQMAERQGMQAAENIIASLKGMSTREFSYQSMGQLCAIGGRNAVAELMGWQLSGYLAWFIWRGVYLFKLPSLKQRIRVAVEWLFDLIFPRAIAYMRTDKTTKIMQAYFAEGDYIFCRGDAAEGFFVIEAGEVEIISGTKDGEPIAVLGKGDFFGEGALLDGRLRNNSARARTNVEVIVFGRDLFSQVSAALSPLSEAVAGAIKRRTAIWQELPEIRRHLDRLSLKKFIEKVQVPPLAPHTSIDTAVRTINENRLDFCFVVDNNNTLLGLVTRTDLMRAIEVAAARLNGSAYSITVDEIMVANPMVITDEDSLLTAVSVMREHGLKRLPVVDDVQSRTLLGYVRIENIMHAVIERMTRLQRSLGSAVSASQDIGKG